MSYILQLNHQLRPKPNTAYRVLDLFAGCGGLSLGFEAAFHSVGYEMDER
ncbi:MAG: DNA cytosine methyltransferase [Saprospiraceae bacterium]|nr:DNA cytosine methyltransferase [Saprospiraceae bacterium]